MPRVSRLLLVSSLLALWSWSASARTAELSAVWGSEPDLRAIGESTELRLALPDGRTTQVGRRSLSRRDGGFVWTGEGAAGERLVLTGEGGRLAGTIFAAEGTYRIFPSPGGGYEIVAAEADGACGGVMHRPAPMAAETSAQTSVETSGQTVGSNEIEARAAADSRRGPWIDLLVAYDRAAREAVGGKRNIRAVLQHYVDLTNVAFHNSEVEARVRLVDSIEVLLPTSVSGSNFAILSWLEDSSEVAAARARSGADLVGALSENSNRACGVAAMIYRPGGPGASKAYFESRRSCGAETFAHEIGHLMGADHDPVNAGFASGRYIYGRGHLYDGRYRTIMSYTTECSAPCPAQPFFSNPGIRYDGRATGRRERDNARILSEFAADIEGFTGAVNTPAACDLPIGHPDYCVECGPCVAGEGNCEADVDCASGLSCAPGAGSEFGFDDGVGVCKSRGICALAPGDPNYCVECGPCSYGDGDCDSNRECQEGLTCLDDQGEIFGLEPWADVCGFREGDYCPLEPGHPDYCKACGPCGPGEGNCISNGACRGVLSCIEGAGAELGLGAGVNVCLAAAPSDCPFSSGNPDYCALCGVCDLGEGDCDGDRQCLPGLQCVDGAGVDFGFGAGVDVCLEAAGGGPGGLAAPKKLKARVLSGQRVRLRWKDKSAGELGFHVEVSRDGGRFERLLSTAANKKKQIVEGLGAGTYTFRVQAFGADGVSAYSNERTVTLD